MTTKNVFVASAFVAIVLTSAALGTAADWGLKEGTPDLKSAGPLAFGPDGILLVGDTKAATIFAIDTGDASENASDVQLDIAGLNLKVADLLGASASETRINDLVVNPLSGSVYLSVERTGAEAAPALMRVSEKGELGQLSLKNVAFLKVALPNPPEDKVTGQGRRQRNLRDESITDLAYADGKVLVSGISNDASPSNIREIAFPFADADQGTSIEIYHGAHGRFEDYATVRTFVPFNVGGEPSLLAGFTCTPLVKFPISSLASGKKVRGTTVAELGNRNRPLDMFVYEKDGKRFLLMSNSKRGVMKISTAGIDREDGISERVSGGGTAGQSYETVNGLDGVVQLDRLNDQSAVVLVQADSGSQDLRTIALP